MFDGKGNRCFNGGIIHQNITARPEYAMEEIQEIRKRRSYTLMDSWNRVASRGSDQRS